MGEFAIVLQVALTVPSVPAHARTCWAAGAAWRWPWQRRSPVCWELAPAPALPDAPGPGGVSVRAHTEVLCQCGPVLSWSGAVVAPCCYWPSLSCPPASAPPRALEQRGDWCQWTTPHHRHSSPGEQTVLGTCLQSGRVEGNQSWMGTGVSVCQCLRPLLSASQQWLSCCQSLSTPCWLGGWGCALDHMCDCSQGGPATQPSSGTAHALHTVGIGTGVEMEPLHHKPGRFPRKRLCCACTTFAACQPDSENSTIA